MIIVRHLTGSRAGTEDRPDSKLDRIVFGRRLSCDVVFPPEETIIAREHFALVRKPPGPGGHWTVELFGEPFVAINGIAAEPGQRLPVDAKIELGKHGGPSFTVRVEPDAATDNLAVTAPQEQVEAARVVATKAKRSAKLARRIAVVGLAIAVIAWVSVSYLSQHQQGISASVRDHLLRSAFFVEAPEGTATAFPIGPHTLATNSHVGELFTGLKPGQHMYVLSPGKHGKLYEVVDAKLHPGFDALQKFLAQDVIRRRFAGLFVPGYDVATLTVKGELSSDTIMKLASTAELRALKDGDLLATAGYPAEGVIGSGAQAHGATPEYHTGTVTGLTDFFFLPTDFAHSQLIHDSVPAAGGSSGSAIVNTKGDVVALLNAGNSYQPGPHQARVSSGVLINYAQRVDLLKDLLSGKAKEEVADAHKYWVKQFSVFSTGIDIVDKLIVSRLEDANRKHGARIKLVKVMAKKGTLSEKTRVKTKSGGFQRQDKISITEAANTMYVILAFCPAGSDLQLWIYRGNTMVGHAGTAMDKKPHTFAPWIVGKTKQADTVTAWIISPNDKNVNYDFQVLKVEKLGVANKGAKNTAG